MGPNPISINSAPKGQKYTMYIISSQKGLVNAIHIVHAPKMEKKVLFIQYQTPQTSIRLMQPLPEKCNLYSHNLYQTPKFFT